LNQGKAAEMVESNWPRCAANTHREEGSDTASGGWTINPNDNGNWTGGARGKGLLLGTKWGIAANSAQRLGIDPHKIRTMSREEADRIYHRFYWRDAWGPQWPMGLDQVTYDATVNSGAGRGPLWTCRALGFAKADLAAITKAKSLDGNGRIAAVKRAVSGQRMTFLRGLRGASGFSSFGKGWTARCSRMEALGVKMVLEDFATKPAEITKQLQKESGEAKATSNKAGSGAAAGGTATAGTGAGATQLDSFDWTAWLFIGGVGVALLAVTIGCAWLWWKHRERAQAYLDVARGLVGV
jgi:lysozyme family protein